MNLPNLAKRRRSYILVLACALLWSGCSGPTARLEEYEVHGVDLSRYQEVVDWQKLKLGGYDFVFLKATEGKSYVDPTFAKRWSVLRDHDFVRGAYHYYKPSVAATRQADHFINTVLHEDGDLPPVLDFEEVGTLNREQIVNELRLWLTTVEISTGVKPIIYTNFKLYNKYIAGAFDGYPIWLSQYNQTAPRLGSNRQWVFWQYGNRGRVEGIEGDVDVNVFNGTYIEFRKMLIRRPAVSGS
jgi:lysozyme